MPSLAAGALEVRAVLVASEEMADVAAVVGLVGRRTTPGPEAWAGPGGPMGPRVEGEPVAEAGPAGLEDRRTAGAFTPRGPRS
jgi:hypothetical protein